eukprot:CAMPEP_0203706284 /NCGR_PEP_ID=MMETSP0091-20130426/52502_1 /ASSEMBLY_ACC=CAM_ASM_001089 /TAXON_ID=426623 /ORGANISM="Chaetoceros affinis, Strain CCMP159" /LENGTH=43 /DNA_ID= /DNA_START= /DNA_END= /DNA_ORIENTATION=
MAKVKKNENIEAVDTLEDKQSGDKSNDGRDRLTPMIPPATSRE